MPLHVACGFRTDGQTRPEYDSAIESLAYAINPVRSRDANRRKALTVKDLLIKVSVFRFQ